MKLPSNIIFVLLFLVFAGTSFLVFNSEEKNKKPHVLTEEEEEGGLPLQDRMDLAIKQEIELTKDPATNTVPRERLYAAYLKTQQNGFRTSAAIPGMIWKERGPDNCGGRTRAIMIDPNDATKKTVWAAGVGGGLWKTTDITATTVVWTPVNDFFANIAITTLAYNPVNTQIMYFGSGEGRYNADAIRGNGIWKSTDGGTTWAQLASTTGANFQYIQKIVVHPVTGDVYAGTRTAGLQRSQNGGTTWTKVLGTGVNAASNNAGDIEIAADNSIYAGLGDFGGSDGVYKSLSGNVGGWTKMNTAANGFPTANIARIELANAPSDANTVYAMVENLTNQTLLNIYKTIDGGANWTTCTLPSWRDQNCAAPSNDMTRTQAWYDLIAAVDPANANTVFVGGVDIMRTTNGGTNWTQMTNWAGACGFQYVHADQHALLYDAGNSNVLYFGNDGGVWRTTNASAATPTIIHKSDNYNVTQFYACAMHPTAFSDYFLAGAQDNGSHQFKNPGVGSSVQVTGGDGCFVHIDQDQPQYQWTSYVYNNFYRSSDCGQTWTGVSPGSGLSSTGSFVNPSDYDNTANIMYSGSTSGTYIRWTNAQTGATFQQVAITSFAAAVTHISVSQNTVNRVFFGLANGRVVRVDGANAIASGSAGTWINNGAGMPAGSVSCVAIENGNDNHLLVTYSNYGVNSVWETTNGGTTWTSVEGNVPDMPVRWALFNPLNNTQAVIATELGVWSTDLLNGGATNWQPSNTGEANVSTHMLQIRTSDNLIAAATHGRGLFTCDVFCAPNAAFKSDKTVTYVGSPISFYDASFKATSWLWDFGDGFTSTAQNPFHSYTGTGYFNVTLTINGVTSIVKNNYIKILPNKGTPYTIAMGGNFDVNPNDFGAPVLTAPIVCSAGVTNFERGNSAIAGKNGTLSGTFAWVTGLTQTNYVNNAEAWLYSPNYNFTAAGVYTLQFYRKMSVETGYDGFIVEYSINKGNTWTPIGTVAPPNWYDIQPIIQTAFPANQPYFNVNKAAYTLSQYDVSFLAGNASVAFRLTFKSDESAPASGVAIDNFEIIAPTNAPLPVEFISFMGKDEKDYNQLLWKTASENINKGFEVQRSVNGKDFSAIGFVKGAGTTTTLSAYKFDDHNIERNLYYYRLKQMDFNGNYNYSNVIAINRKDDAGTGVEFIYPNPFTDNITIVLNKKVESPIAVMLIDLNGKKVFEKNIMPADFQVMINFSSLNLSQGTYLLNIVADNKTFTQKLFRNK